MTDLGVDRRGWCSRLRKAHLHDYSPAAARFWTALVVLGALSLVASVLRLAPLPLSDLLQILAFGSIAALAAAFPVQIPRTKHSIAAGDVIVFLMLALYGAAGAVAAAALEALVAAMRTSARLSSRLASLSAAAVAMSIAGAAFPAGEHALVGLQMPRPAAHLAALMGSVVIYFVVSTWALMQIVCLKRGERLRLTAWFDGTAWLGALYLGAAIAAGLLSLNASASGRSATAVVILTIAASVALLRAHFRRRIAEDSTREARVAAAELEADNQRKRFHSAFTQASIGMSIVSRAGVIVQANDAMATLLGRNMSGIIGRPFREFLHSGDAALLDRRLDEVIERRLDTFSIELRCVTAEREAWVSLHCARFDDDGGSQQGLILQLHDITSRRRAEGDLRHIAYHDSLTDLANRNCFHEQLDMAIARARAGGTAFALMYLDIDRFKLVNDALGHAAGDALLREVGRRLRDCVRPQDLVARLGGDEFAILIEGSCHEPDVVATGQRILARLDDPCWSGETELRPLASMGITFSAYGYEDANAMLRDADLAMYEAKANGRGQLALFDQRLHAQLGQKLQLQSDLRRTLENGELGLAFQPLRELATGRVVGCEALARWHHPVHGAVNPAQFVALAEETGSIELLTRWAIDASLKQLAEWRRHADQAQRDFTVHVNVSGKNLSRAGLVDYVSTMLAKHDVPAHQLVLEITESTIMTDHQPALGALRALRDLGVGISIDDFGTGYSSLSYLTTLPFDCLKIDRSFVSGMNDDPHNVEIVRTVLSLGRALGKVVIAEGIETAAQADLLRTMGVAVGQGYLLGRPMRAEDLHAALASTRPVVAEGAQRTLAALV